MIQAIVASGGLELVLHVNGYEFPQFDTGWDANWLLCDIELNLNHHHGAVHAQHHLTILTVELADFAHQLRAVNQQLTGHATLQHSEEQIGLTITLDHGSGTIHGYLADPVTTRLSFEQIPVDQSFLPALISDLEAILAAYPARGNLTDG